MSDTPAFDALVSALFDGPTKAVDIMLVPGTEEGRTREDLASALLGSMTRLGIVKDGRLADPDTTRRP